MFITVGIQKLDIRIPDKLGSGYWMAIAIWKLDQTFLTTSLDHFMKKKKNYGCFINKMV
jgi:hypothetical protein